MGYTKKETFKKYFSNPLNRLKTIYSSMIGRCYKKNNGAYNDYGAKGITVCKEWVEDRQKFYDWAIKSGFKYEPDKNGRNKLTLDRIDTTKGYSPDNCRWITNEEQANNKKMNVVIEVNGEKIHLRQLAKDLNMNFNTLFKRWKYTKMPIEKVIQKTDFRKNNRVIRKPKGDVV